MATSIGTLSVELQANTAKFTAGLKGARQDISGLQRSMDGMAGSVRSWAAGFLSIGTAVLAVRAVTSAITESEVAGAKLNAVLRATGHAAGLTARDIDQMATAMQGSTLFDDEDIKNASAVMATFRSVSGDTFRQSIALAADMSAVFGGDLQSSVLQLGKALENPLQGLTALRRIGVTFTPVQQELIKNLVESNRLLDAQGVILQGVRDQIGGAAVAIAGEAGLTKAIHDAKSAWGEFLESFGEGRTAPMRAALSVLEGFKTVMDQLRIWWGNSDLEGQILGTLDALRDLQAKETGRGSLSDSDHAERGRLQRQLADLRAQLATERALPRGAGAPGTDDGTGGSARANEKRFVDEISKEIDHLKREAHNARDIAEAARQELRGAMDTAASSLADNSAAQIEANNAELTAFEKDFRETSKQVEKSSRDMAAEFNRNMANMFEDGLAGNIRSLADFARRAVDIWRNMLAQMGAERLAGSALVQSIGSALFGGGKGGGASAAGKTISVPTLAVSAAGGAPTNVYQSVNLTFQSLDPRGTAELLTAHAGTIQGIVADGVQRSRGYALALRGPA